jgi:hypothetical protein
VDAVISTLRRGGAEATRSFNKTEKSKGGDLSAGGGVSEVEAVILKAD